MSEQEKHIVGVVYTDTVLTPQELAELEAWIGGKEYEKLEVITVPLSTGRQALMMTRFVMKDSTLRIIPREGE